MRPTTLRWIRTPPPGGCLLRLLPQAKVGWNTIRVGSPPRVEGRTLSKKSLAAECNKENERCPPWANPQHARDTHFIQVEGGLAPTTLLIIQGDKSSREIGHGSEIP